MNEDWGEMMNRDPLWHGPNKIDGYQDWMLPNRISYEFGLTGPRYVWIFPHLCFTIECQLNKH